MAWLFPTDPTPVLEDGHLLLRAAGWDDYRQWSQLRRESQAFLKPFEPHWSEADLTPAVFRQRLERGRRQAREGTEFSFLIFLYARGQDDKSSARPRPSGKNYKTLVGGITLSNIRRRAAQHVNLGYWMGVHAAGRGIMSRAVSLTLPFIFGELGLYRAHAACLPHNHASRRVLEKNGFREEGFAQNYLQIDGRWQDHVLFGLTRESYDRHAGHP